jgi:hypothetical protein
MYQLGDIIVIPAKTMVWRDKEADIVQTQSAKTCVVNKIDGDDVYALCLQNNHIPRRDYFTYKVAHDQFGKVGQITLEDAQAAALGFADLVLVLTPATV